MNIVVLVKQVPDSGAERQLTADGTIDRENATRVINEMDEYAIEEGLRLADTTGGEVTLVTMGPDEATESIRKALSMGAHKALHVLDPALHGSCALATSRVLAQALQTINPDIIICGAESTDGRVGALPAMLAERLNITALTGARKLTVEDGSATIERQLDDGYQVVQGSLPAIVSVWDTINEPRYPSFRGIMQAKSKPVTTLSLADLNVDPSTVGSAGASTEVVQHAPRPPRQAGVKIVDEGDAGDKLVEFLLAEKLV
ncbi:MAG: electron transfer flavoprotein subunit beta/FixA family protein [Corynebacteriales bacterium]|nr:electron transfer flavoprotein subunit beta/FixA family protein [Mycobacteriales bacterium]